MISPTTLLLDIKLFKVQYTSFGISNVPSLMWEVCKDLIA